MLIPLNGLAYNRPMGPLAPPPIPQRRGIAIYLSRHDLSMVQTRQPVGLTCPRHVAALSLPRYLCALHNSRHSMVMWLPRTEVEIHV